MKLRINTLPCAIAAALVLPMVGSAQKPCPEGEPTAESYTWDFAGEASELLATVESGADRLAYIADGLSYYPTTNRTSHASRWMQVRDQINDLSETLCRLQIIHRVTLPWQQEAIDRTLPEMRAMAANAQSAIEFLNENPGNLFNPDYRDYARSVFQTSSDLSAMLSDFQDYAQAKTDVNRLEQALELSPAP